MSRGVCPSAASTDAGLATTDGGACLNLDTSRDPLNCGACGHRCAPETLVSGEDFPNGLIAADATNVYWTSTLSDAVMKMPRGGGTPIEIAARDPGSRRSSAIAVDTASVYWITYGAGDHSAAVLKVPLEGGTSITLASDLALPAGGMAVDGTGVYWLSAEVGFPLMKVPLDGGPPSRLTLTENARSIVADGTNVYYTSVDRTARSQGSIMKVPASGGTPVTLARGQTAGYFEARPLVMDAANLYWTTSIDLDDNGRVMKVPLQGGIPTTLASGLRTPTAIAIDGAAVYWTNLGWGDGIEGTEGSVMSVPVNGGTVTTLAVRQGDPGTIAVSGTSVYWVNDYFDGRIMRIDKNPCESGVCQ